MPVVGSVKPVGVVYVPLPLTVAVSVSTRRAAQRRQREGDRAGREVAARQRGRVGQGRRRGGAQRDLVGLGVVLSVGLAGLTVTCSLPWRCCR